MRELDLDKKDHFIVAREKNSNRLFIVGLHLQSGEKAKGLIKASRIPANSAYEYKVFDWGTGC